MFYAITWMLMALLLGLWSAAAWALHALLQWSTAHTDGLAGLPALPALLQTPGWLAAWLPQGSDAMGTAMLAVVSPILEALPGLTSGLATWLSPMIWVLWAVGGLVLLFLGAVFTLLISAAKRRLSTPAIR